MLTTAVILSEPHAVGLGQVTLRACEARDLVVDVEWSGISTGTERLLWSGRMPPFPGMGYPLVPGYETIGRVVSAGSESSISAGTRVFVPGARAFNGINALFGGAARRLVVEDARVVPVPDALDERATLLALAATAHHIAPPGSATPPELIVGHGVLGRLVARLCMIAGCAPVVWERDSRRRAGATGYSVVDPEEDSRRDYERIVDVSGAAGILDPLVARLRPGGEIVLGGFYDEPVQFAFPPAFMREARFRVAAQWSPADLTAVTALVTDGHLSLDGLVTHRMPAAQAESAYRQAFEDRDCLKMVLDWRTLS
ncbi:MAG TPA: chlorophyll synthesis pathway protein BchC [Hyphomicrobiaceae bacterium]|nr:chlorophyll synthesis pathway protein BchC [Hyphomicrobiaceae bacterium]